MKFKQKSSSKTLSDKIADALTVKPGVDIEDDQVFGTKPKTVSRVDFSSSESEDEAAISDFRKRNVNLLSEINKKYEGKVTSRKNLEESSSEQSEESDIVDESNEESDVENSTLESGKTKDATVSDSEESEIEEEIPKLQKSTEHTDSESDDTEESDDYSITQFKKQIAESSDEEDNKEGDDEDSDDDDDDDGDEGDGYDISQQDEPIPENFEHIKKQNVSEEAKKGGCVRNQLLLWEGLLEMRIHLQRCMTTANQMPLPETHEVLKGNNNFDEECNTTKANITNVLDK